VAHVFVLVLVFGLVLVLPWGSSKLQMREDARGQVSASVGLEEVQVTA